MTKKTLQELFPSYELMTIAECLNYLKWTAEYQDGDERGTGEITCECGGKVKIGGWLGAEYALCQNCEKGMQDLTGMLPHPAMKHGAGVVQCIDYDNTIIPEDGRVWTPLRFWGFGGNMFDGED